jgi:hypothetical protein
MDQAGVSLALARVQRWLERVEALVMLCWS